ncbi:MAG TPA: RnfABCDGE type electron transport complex subunit D [Candidatus Binataceae bacterium]|nr:RnfABCDGE type electron transport complex subunit D [Candidatus Binataceae bacterium]
MTSDVAKSTITELLGWPLRARDPRLAQVAVLGTILVLGAALYDFALDPRQILLTFASAWCAQAAVDHFAGRGRVNYKSALITALGIALLLRADTLWAHPLAAAVAIASKSMFRIRGKHLFNPSCFGVILALIALPGVWVSPGQWGNGPILAGWIAVAGTMVVSRAARGDTSTSFVLFYGGAMCARVIWLGQRLAVLMHHLGSGSLLLFAFFMISDPRTAPDEWRGRLAHCATVAGLAFVLGFHFYVTNPLVWALFLAAPAVPLWDAIFRASRFEWESKGESDDLRVETYPDSRAGDDPAKRNRIAGSGPRVLRILRGQGGERVAQPDVESGACPS